MANYPIRREVGSFVMTKAEKGAPWKIALLDGTPVGEAETSAKAFKLIYAYTDKVDPEEDED